MRTFPIDKGESSGRSWAFEIDNAGITLAALMHLLAEVSEVTEVRRGGSYFSNDDVRVRFLYRGAACEVWEPWGDNSRYWIGPANAKDLSIDMTAVRDAFERHQPGLIMSLIGFFAYCTGLLISALVWLPVLLLRLLVGRRPAKPGKIRGS